MIGRTEEASILLNEVFFYGPTLFSGNETSVKISALPAGSGIIFKRIDLENSPTILACLDNVIKTPRTTILGKDHAKVILTEHLMATLFAYGIKDAMIEIDGEEVPIGDGSALHIVQAIDKAGIEAATENRFRMIRNSFHYENGNQSIVAFPSSEFQVTYVLNYPDHPILNQQIHTFSFNLEKFKKEIAPCRTFALKSEVEQMKEFGVIKSNSLDHGVVIDGAKILNPDGLRFDNEMARHKILDFLGDFALANLDVSLHNVSIRSGHQANIEFSKKVKRSVLEGIGYVS